MAEIGDTGVAFDKVAREWRCKYTAGPSGGPGDSASLKECQALLKEFLPKLKALPKAEITRQVCGGCLDFKVSIVQPLEEHGAWAGQNYNPLEEEFVADALRSGNAPYDIVFCRNLLIYLTPAARSRAERALDRLLKPDGLLVLGAAEPPIMKGEWMPAGDSSVFALRRGIHAPAGTSASAGTREAGARKPAPKTPDARRPRGEPAAPVEADVDAAAPSLDEVLGEAGSMANARRFSDAITFCEHHMRRLGPSPALFFLMGMLHQSAGDGDRAEGCFHKTLYLDASHDEAILALALLAAQRGDVAMAENYRQSAARILARKAAL